MTQTKEVRALALLGDTRMHLVWSKVGLPVSSSGCMPWLAGKDRAGYGKFTLNIPGGKGIYLRAHRLVYAKAAGEPCPPDLHLDHLCRNPTCVRPDHLEPVTSKENTRRSPLNRAHRESCDRGHRFDFENTTFYRSRGHWVRRCRECSRQAVRGYRARKKESTP